MPSLRGNFAGGHVKVASNDRVETIRVGFSLRLGFVQQLGSNLGQHRGYLLGVDETPRFALLMTVFSNEGVNVKIILQKNVSPSYDQRIVSYGFDGHIMHNHLKLLKDLVFATRDEACSTLCKFGASESDFSNLLYRPLGSTIDADWNETTDRIEYVGTGWNNVSMLDVSVDPVKQQHAFSESRSAHVYFHNTPNLLMVEQGYGVVGERMLDDLLGSNSSGKFKNPILGKSDMTLVASRSATRPYLVFFTVVLRLVPPGMEHESYVALVGRTGDVFSVIDDSDYGPVFCEPSRSNDATTTKLIPLSIPGTLFVSY